MNFLLTTDMLTPHSDPHLRQIYLETLDSNVTREFFQVVHKGVTESTVDLFYWDQSTLFQAFRWWNMFRPHSNSSTPRQGWGESNGDGPPSPRLILKSWGEREWRKGDQNGKTVTWELVLIFEIKDFLSDSDSCDLWTKEINDSWKSRELG